MENILGNRIKTLRERENLTQIEFAKILNIGNTTLSQYETGQRVPSDEIKAKIADFFDVTVDYLLGRSNHRKLTKKDEKDIEKIIEETKQKIESTEGLMLDGQVLNEEDVDSIVNAMRVGLELAKMKNKDNYIRKKRNAKE